MSHAVVGALLASGGSVVALTTFAAPADASGLCSKARAGDTRKVYFNSKHYFSITERKRIEVARGTEFHDSVSWSQTESHTNSVKTSGEVSASVKVGIFGGAEAKIGRDYGHDDTRSTYRASSEQWDITQPGVYYLARGFDQFRIDVALQRCRRPNISDPSYVWMTYNSGSVAGFSKVVGSIRCSDSYRAGTFSRQVKNSSC